MKIKHKIIVQMVVLIFLAASIFTVRSYITQKRLLLENIDEKLYGATLLLKEYLPRGFHDALEPDSFTQEEYDTFIVQRNNEICRQLNLQYLWSCLRLDDGRIVFTTSSSPSKDVKRHDHAGFFEVHRDPDAFARVFSTMKTDYSSFDNEWGRGRMVLVPFMGANGRAYCFGASMSMNEVNGVLRRKILEDSISFFLVVLVGCGLSVAVANSLSKPIIELTARAGNIARGSMENTETIGGSSELVSLSKSISVMSSSIREKIEELETAKKELEESARSLEKKVRERTQELVDTQERLLRAEKLITLGKVAGALSHELRNPLGVIKNAIYYIRMPKTRPHQEFLDEYLEIIDAHVQVMDRIIENALDYVRPKYLNLEKNDFNHCIDEVIASLSIPPGITIERSYCQQPPFYFDQFRMRQVLTNLIVNAVQAMGESGSLSIRTQCSGEHFTVCIGDTGGGIRPEDLPKVFEPLFSTKARGIGLGLSLVKEIIECHSGRITIDSHQGSGTRVEFRIPLVQTSQEEA